MSSCYFLLIVLCILVYTCGGSSDTLVEHEVGGTSVAEIFKLNGEGFFRDKEVSWKLFLLIYLLQIFMFGLLFLELQCIVVECICTPDVYTYIHIEK